MVLLWGDDNTSVPAPSPRGPRRDAPSPRSTSAQRPPSETHAQTLQRPPPSGRLLRRAHRPKGHRPKRRRHPEAPRAWLTDRKAVDPDTDDTILLLAATRGDAALFDALLAEAQRTEDREDRTLLFTTLGGFQDPKLLARALGLLLDPKIDLRDSGALLRTAMGRRETREQAWDFFKQHFATLAGRLRDDEKSYLVTLAGELCDAARRDEAKAFLTGPVSHIDGGPMRLAMTLEGIDQCIAIRERNAPGIAAFLKEY